MSKKMNCLTSHEINKNIISTVRLTPPWGERVPTMNLKFKIIDSKRVLYQEWQIWNWDIEKYELIWQPVECEKKETE